MCDFKIMVKLPFRYSSQNNVPLIMIALKITWRIKI